MGYTPATLLAPLLVLAGACASVVAQSFDWPQWQGPHRTNVSSETGLLKAWPSDGLKRVWAIDTAGNGYSGPAIADGRLFIMGTRGDGEVLIAVDANTGSELWVTEIDEVLDNDWGKGPRGTPTVDGPHLYAVSGSGTLVCADAATGEVVWRKTMRSLGGRRPNWGYCESILIDDSFCLCTPGGKSGTIAALNKETGDLVWQSAGITDDAHYSSIGVASVHGKKQYVQLTKDHVFGLDAADGKLAWQVDWPGQTAVIPTPIFHDNSVYVTSGYGAGCMRVSIGSDNQVETMYSNKNMKNHHGGVVLIGGHLYGYSDGVGWLCQDFATGETIWADKKSLGKGSLTSADGMLFCLTEDKGEIVLVEATTTGFKENGRMTLSPQSESRSARGKIWTHPVVANGKLYLRDQEHLACFEVKVSP